MHARVAQFEGIDVEAARRTMDEAEAILQPLLEEVPGYRGELALLSDDGTFVAITFFDSLADAEAAEPTFDEVMPAKLGHLFSEWSGRRTSVSRCEVVVDARG